MKFTPTILAGAFLIEPESITDERGFFARSFCQNEFASHDLSANIAQCNISYNKTHGIIRGMHYQRAPSAEAKLVRCTSGSIYDVIIDLRVDSSTYQQWIAYELNSKNRSALYIPKGFAHGFQTLKDNTEVFYQMFDFFSPQQASGIRWDDPTFNIDWPLSVHTISGKDHNYPDFNVSML